MKIVVEKRSLTEVIIRSEVDAGKREAPITCVSLVIGKVFKVNLAVEVDYLEVGEQVTVTV